MTPSAAFAERMRSALGFGAFLGLQDLGEPTDETIISPLFPEACKFGVIMVENGKWDLEEVARVCVCVRCACCSGGLRLVYCSLHCSAVHSVRIHIDAAIEAIVHTRSSRAGEGLIHWHIVVALPTIKTFTSLRFIIYNLSNSINLSTKNTPTISTK